MVFNAIRGKRIWYLKKHYAYYLNIPLPGRRGSTNDERMRIGVPTREAYLEIFEGDTVSVNSHLAVLSHIRGNLEARANYIQRLPADKLNEVLEIIMKKI